MLDWLYFWRRTKESAQPDAPEPVPISRTNTPDAVRAQVFMQRNLRQEMGGNHRAPVASPLRIIDLQSYAVGRWAMEMAVEFPAATVIAFAANPPDLSLALDDDLAAVPPNIQLLQGDITQPLPFSDQSFDLVSWRMLYARLPALAWPTLLAECVRILRPQGWLEGMEQLPFPRGEQRASIATIIGWNSEVLRQDGKDPFIALKLPKLFQEAGLRNIATHDVLTTDLNDQRRERIRQSGLRYVDASRGPVLAHNIATAAEFDRVAARARQDFQGRFVTPGLKTNDIIGQKPG